SSCLLTAPPPTHPYTLSLHDALPISQSDGTFATEHDGELPIREEAGGLPFDKRDRRLIDRAGEGEGHEGADAALAVRFLVELLVIEFDVVRGADDCVRSLF